MQAKSYEFLKTNPKNIITSSFQEALLVAEVAKYLGVRYVVFPDFRPNIGDDMRSYKEELFELNSALYQYYKQGGVVISPISTMLRPLPSKKYYKSLSLEFAQTIDLSYLKNQLVCWGYEVVSIIQKKGEVSFRGDIVDIYPINSDFPYRISLFDTEIENIRTFDEWSQKSIKEVDSATIIPAIAGLGDEEYKTINENVENSQYDVFNKDIYSLGYWYLDKNNLFDRLNLIYDMTSQIREYEIFHKIKNINFEIIPEAKNCKEFKPSNLKEFIQHNKNKKIILLAKNKILLEEKGIEGDFVESDAIVNIQCQDQFILSLNNFVSKKRKIATILVDDLKKGDFVVHEEHGIGKFNGLKQIKVLGKTGEFAEILYANDDKLLLPMENFELIQRYIAPGGVVPVLDKMGKSSFKKNKEKIKEKIFAIAADIIKLSALRESISPKPLCFDGVDEFISKAGFNHTKDQIQAIKDIMQDMKSRIMDRLLSGDVGFGKTEIAMVASFIIANNNYQVAVVVPTTILANQHYESFVKRFQEYDFRISKIDRFTSTKDKKKIQEELKDGEIDILIATHSAFNLEYKNLGLVIIDEEHKFGVKQKEKLKEMVKNVHLLSMSATPIPRSLNLALSKIKGLSALNTPPKNKQETRTFVKEYSDATIKEIILREINRGGQVFYIYNNIALIEQTKQKVQKLIPNLRILTLHAKLTPSQIEKAMVDFVDKKYDLLISTTIIESGIHIPNVNSVIVENADRFGMADLHQIRGRVGRGKKEGYAYFVVQDKNKLSDDAKKRLQALEENSFLGSGAVLAMHDLEIRGGGNIIGQAQSGQIKNVGYSMYIKMLEDALKSLDGKTQENDEISIKLNIDAYISPSIIEDERVRVEVYKRLAKAQNIQELYDIQKEILDRFGKIDTVTKNFFDKIKIKIKAKQKGIQSISNYGENITIIYKNDKKFIKAKAKDDSIILQAILEELK